MKRAGTITLELRAEDAEPILRQAAIDAAKFGAYLDFITIRTWNAPGLGGPNFKFDRALWREIFLRAKRTVESFGVDYEQTSEPETISRYDGEPYNGAPVLISDVHSCACRAAADRVVRRWKESLTRACDRVA